MQSWLESLNLFLYWGFPDKDCSWQMSLSHLKQPLGYFSCCLSADLYCKWKTFGKHWIHFLSFYDTCTTTFPLFFCRKRNQKIPETKLFICLSFSLNEIIFSVITWKRSVLNSIKVLFLNRMIDSSWWIVFHMVGEFFYTRLNEERSS